MGRLLIAENPRLEGLDGLGGLKSLSHIAVDGNPALVSVAGLSGTITTLSTYGGGLAIARSDSLTDLDGFREIAAWPLRVVTLWDNPRLVSARGISHLVAEDAQYIRLMDLAVLEDIEFLRPVRSAIQLDLWGLPRVASLDGLAGLEEVTDALTLGRLDRVQDFTGLSSLRFVLDLAIGMRVCDNKEGPPFSGPHSLDGLENLQAVGVLHVNSNADLVDISALDSWVSFENLFSMEFRANPRLPHQDVESFSALVGAIPDNVDNCGNLDSPPDISCCRGIHPPRP